MGSGEAVNPSRKAIESKSRKRPSRDDLLSFLLERLRQRKPVFAAHRVQGEVRVDRDGKTVGYVRIEAASANVGLSLKVKKEYGGLAAPVVYAKDGQHERKKAAVVCAFLCHLLDDRPSEERVKSLSKYADSKNWFDSFDSGHKGELSEAYAVIQSVTSECKTLVDVFSLVGDAMKSARGEDLKESIDRVSKELPFLVGRISAEEWLGLFNTVVVDQVHKL